MITAETRVSELLDRFPQALEVLLLASSHFQKLKNPLLRHFAAPRASIADAARIGGVDLHWLLDELNVACGLQPAAAAPVATASPVATPKPAALAGVHSADIVDLDVRDDIGRNEDPFKKIIGATKQLRDGQVLHLINIFEPAPLYGVLARRGFAHWSECVDGVWHIYFFQESRADAAVTTEATGEAGGAVELDVSGLEPPEPMVRVLAALAAMRPGSVLVVRHHREPLMLYDKLVEQGYEWTTTQTADEKYRIEIHRRGGA